MNDAFTRVSELIDASCPRVIAIDGGAASGKTTLAAQIAARYDCNVVHMDDFFLPPERKTPARLSEPGGNVDYERFKSEVTDKLLSNTGYTYNRYDCHNGTLTPVYAPPKTLTVVEGVYSLHPLLRHVFDLKILLRVEPDEQYNRILKRGGVALAERFINEWIPLENLYLERLKIAEICDILL